MVRLGVVTFMLLAVGCAGRSIATEEAGGTSGAGGDGSGGSGGRGGTTTGGTGGTGADGGSGGSVATGGSMQGGTGGTVATGGAGGSVSVGGATTGGTGGSAMAGAAGAGAVCGLPLVSGPCDAAFHQYGYDPMRGHCVRFPYGGCEGNANRFDTLAECEQACRGSSLGGCPETRPDLTKTMCEPSALRCTYSWQDGCLCVPTSGYFCSKIDPECARVLLDVPPPEDDECVGDDCVARVVIPPDYLCTCGSGGYWECAAATR